MAKGIKPAKGIKLPKAKMAKFKLQPQKTKPKAARLKAITPKPEPARPPLRRPPPPLSIGASSAVLDRLWGVIETRRDADPVLSHSARLLSRGTAKIAQKFGEEAVECLIEAVGGDPAALVAESADVLYHLLVMWVDAGVRPEDVWTELQRREGISGVAEKASRSRKLPLASGLQTTKIP